MKYVCQFVCLSGPSTAHSFDGTTWLVVVLQVPGQSSHFNIIGQSSQGGHSSVTQWGVGVANFRGNVLHIS